MRMTKAWRSCVTLMLLNLPVLIYVRIHVLSWNYMIVYEWVNSQDYCFSRSLVLVSLIIMRCRITLEIIRYIFTRYANATLDFRTSETGVIIFSSQSLVSLIKNPSKRERSLHFSCFLA